MSEVDDTMTMNKQVLMYKRNTLKRQIVGFYNFVDECTTDIAQLKERYRAAPALWAQFQAMQLELEVIHEIEKNQEEYDVSVSTANKYENLYYQGMAKCNAKLAVKEEQGDNSLAQIQAQLQNLGQGHNNDQFQVKLPKLTIEPFDGNYDNWLAFKDAFVQGVHSKNIPRIQKFQLLRGLLKGNAMKVISALEASDENYEEAWKLINKRYENVKLLTNRHMKALFEMVPISKASASNLRSIVDEVRSRLRSLNSLGQPTEHWDTIIIYLVTNKLDYSTREEWEKHVGQSEDNDGEHEAVKLEDLLDFLDRRGATREVIEKNRFRTDKPSGSQSFSNKEAEKKVMVTATSRTCNFCQKPHAIYKCDQFMALSPSERLVEIFKRKLCANCLKPGHVSKVCTSQNCKVCNHKHNTLLHGGHLNRNDREKKENDSYMDNKEKADSKQHEQANGSVVTHCAPKNNSCVILSTARVYVQDINGKLHSARALLDTGAQINMMTEEFAKKLGLPLKQTRFPVSAVNQAQLTISKSVDIKMSSTTSRFTVNEVCSILPVITHQLPQIQLDKEGIDIPPDVELADPKFDCPGPIDILIGAGLYWKLIEHGEVIVRKNQPVLQNTKLGWIIGGELKLNKSFTEKKTVHLLTMKSLEQQLEKFWLTEEIEDKRLWTREEEDCETHFKETYSRDENGRFQVELPKQSNVKLGESLQGAMKRLKSIERRFEVQKGLKERYVKFMEDYETSGHMSIYTTKTEQTEHFYIPHQPILRETSLTTKLRVVFDASAKTTLGTSLNNKLLPGPNLQNDLVEILLRFRTHEYVVTADIEQMFRQVMVAEKDRCLQLILWRREPQDPVKVYSLNTITYGTTCAPYLAMRCLRELANSVKAEYPVTAEVLERDFYMDDLLSGADTIEHAATLQKQLSEILEEGKFHLRKWRSNSPEILQNLESQEMTENLLVIRSQDAIKTLGLLWNSHSDTLQYETRVPDNESVSKRSILSTIALIYDPLGLIGPVIMYAKLILQNLWKLKTDWDAEIPEDLCEKWKLFCESLRQLETFTIPRNVNPGRVTAELTIHGFADASEKGYGACVYALSYGQDNNPQVNLICSKSKVAPLKTLTIPRLELNAARLLARLISVVKRALGSEITDVHLWSDSTITLYWINTLPNNLQIFVANRVAEIHQRTQDSSWHHITSEDNPADVLSRGSVAGNIMQMKLWWHGPQWLPFKENWPEQTFQTPKENLELKAAVHVVIQKVTFQLLRRYSSFAKLQRVVAIWCRFYRYLRRERIPGPLTAEELETARMIILQWTQREEFYKEIASLLNQKSVENSSPLISLKPFLDKNGLIRVGGRLERAEIHEDHKHPIVLPSKHPITTLILREEHLQLLHCGPGHLLSAIRTRYWPLSGAREARKVTQNCVPCRRYKPKTQDYIMADLPQARVEVQTRPFEISGVDYAGPLQVRESRRRGRIHISKGYIAVFICFSTKAIHLELVSDLTSQAFMAALRRFIARRGLCRILHSDNATNFVGASRELKEVYEFLKKNESEIADDLLSKQITWKFIPPRSPHFGGLWEAAVRSVKRHLYTVTKGLSYTYEEYNTLLIEIESVLNSRPLTPLSSDPTDLSALTPSHFLLGCSPSEPVSKSVSGASASSLSRWQHLQKLKRDFWKRWQAEYLHQLQTRTKWTRENASLNKGDLVLLVEENRPPLQWVLGRIIELHPGSDGIARVADVRTNQGTVRRAVKKLCALPVS